MQLCEGESVGDYVSRLERRVKELEPPDGFTVQEWHVGQVYAFLLWPPKGEAERQKWVNSVTMFEDRFPDQTKKFATYMGWSKRSATEAAE